jgi:hypothetical protein
LWYEEGYRLLQPNIENFPNNAMQYRDLSMVYITPSAIPDENSKNESNSTLVKQLAMELCVAMDLFDGRDADSAEKLKKNIQDIFKIEAYRLTDPKDVFSEMKNVCPDGYKKFINLVK